jgi:hypothetical protein
MTTLDKSKLKRILVQGGFPDLGTLWSIFNLDVCEVIWRAAQAEQRKVDAEYIDRNLMSCREYAAAIRGQK